MTEAIYLGTKNNRLMFRNLDNMQQVSFACDERFNAPAVGDTVSLDGVRTLLNALQGQEAKRIELSLNAAMYRKARRNYYKRYGNLR